MSSLTSLARRYPLVLFFFISYLTFFAGALWMAKNPDAPGFLTIYCTGLGALLVVGLTEGPGAGVKGWASRIVRWRVGVGWYAVALGLPIVLRMAAFASNLALGAPAPAPSVWGRWTDVPKEFVLVMLVVALGEEAGFRGYALPKLMEKYSPLVASLILGVLRVIWHGPLFIAGQDSLWVIPIVLSGDILFTWIFQHTRGSVLLAMILHASVNAWGSFFTPMFTGADGERQTMLLAIVFVVTAIGVIAVMGPNLARRPQAQTAVAGSLPPGAN